MTHLRLATASLRERAFRSLLITLSVAISSALLSVVLSTHFAVANMAASSEQPFVWVQAAQQGTLMPIAYLDRVRRQLQGAELFDWGRGVAARIGDQQVFGLWSGNPEHYPDEMPSQFYRVSATDLARWRSERTGILVGSATMASMGWHVGQLVTIPTSDGEVRATVSGELLPKDNSTAVAHFEYLDSLVAEKGKVDTFVVKTSPGAEGQVADQIDGMFALEPVPTLSIPASEFWGGLLRASRFVPALLLRMGIGMVAVTMLIAFSTLFGAVRERVNEFATLYALGFRPRRLFKNVLLEMVLVHAAGAVLGVGAANLAFLGKGVSVGLQLPKIAMSAPASLLAVALTIGLGVVTGILPAAWASRQTRFTWQ
jgi:putative ABC transport system permease protein